MATVEIAKNGNYFALKGVKSENTSKAPPRGTIKTFSKQSQKRLRFAIAKINRQKINKTMLFITLTYPLKLDPDAALWKRNLSTFIKSINRLIPGNAIIWKLEFQKQGNPHFHLLLFPPIGYEPPTNKKELYAWVAETWNRIAAPGNADHLKAGTRVDIVKDPWPFLTYMGKYLSDGLKQAKTKFKLDSLGRFYGIYGRKYLPVTMLETEIDQQSFVQIRRLAYKFLQKKTRQPYTIFRDNQGITLFLNDKEAFRLVEFILEQNFRKNKQFCEYFRTRFDPNRFP